MRLMLCALVAAIALSVVACGGGDTLASRPSGGTATGEGLAEPAPATSEPNTEDTSATDATALPITDTTESSPADTVATTAPPPADDEYSSESPYLCDLGWVAGTGGGAILGVVEEMTPFQTGLAFDPEVRFAWLTVRLEDATPNHVTDTNLGDPLPGLEIGGLLEILVADIDSVEIDGLSDLVSAKEPVAMVVNGLAAKDSPDDVTGEWLVRRIATVDAGGLSFTGTCGATVTNSFTELAAFLGRSPDPSLLLDFVSEGLKGEQDGPIASAYREITDQGDVPPVTDTTAP